MYRADLDRPPTAADQPAGRRRRQLVVEAATDEDFLSLPPGEPDEPDEPDELEPEDPEPEDPEPDDPELDGPDELELPESPDELEDFDESEPPDELSDVDPFDPLAEPSFAAGAVLEPFRLSVR